jgi:hypothetical protein
VKRRIRKLSDEEIKVLFRQEYEKWAVTYTDESFEWNIELCDRAASSFEQIITDVRDKAWKTIESTIEESIDEKQSAQQVRIQMELANLEKLAYKIKINPEDVSLRNQFKKRQENLTEYRRIEAANILAKDMEYQDVYSTTSVKRAFSVCTNVLSRDGPLNLLSKPLTDKEEFERLEANNLTYKNDNVDLNLDSYKSIIPTNDFKFDIDEAKLLKIISKLNKINSFYKIHSDVLVKPLLILLQGIESTKYFPKIFRNSKLTMLPKRVIYSLDAIPKIIERVIHLSLETCLEKYEANNEPTYQMAYIKNRGVESNNLISLSVIEHSLKESNKSCVQSFADLQKAFNKCNRETILKKLHEIAGVGDLMKSWFDKRTYIFKDKKYDFDANCGVLPGTVIGPSGFNAFINEDTELTGRNPDLLWPSCYSDDRSPIANCDIVNSGRYQEILDNSFRFMEKQGCQYHLTGKKAPEMLYFKTRKSESINDISSLTLGGSEIKLVDRVRILGLNIATKSVTGDDSRTILSSYGYFLEPPIGRYKSLANAIQSIKTEFVPSFLKKFVDSYFCGLFNFSSSLYWCRTSSKVMNKIRFYYCISLGAILGFDSYQSVGASSMKTQSVTEKCSFYLKLLDFTGSRSLKDIAIVNARALIKQVFNIKPSWFHFSSKRIDKDSLLNKNSLPKCISSHMKNTVISKVLSLSKCSTRKETKKKEQQLASKKKEIPHYDQIYREVRKYLELKEKDTNAYIPGCEYVDPTFVYSFYLNICKERFSIFETGDRKLAFRESKDPLVKKKGCQLHLQDSSGDEKNCIICSNLIENDNFVKCTKTDCDYMVHTECLTYTEKVTNSTIDLDTYSCLLVKEEEIKLKKIIPKPLIPLSEGCQIDVKNVKDNHNHRRCIFCRKVSKTKLEYSCTENCPYGIHKHCLLFVARKQNLPMMSSRNPLLSLSGFKCCWVKDIINKDLYKINQLSKSTKRNTIYKNEHVYCSRCENFVSIYERDHLLSNCKGFISKGISKRIKFPWSNKVYMDRMFEYTRTEKCNFKIP